MAFGLGKPSPGQKNRYGTFVKKQKRQNKQVLGCTQPSTNIFPQTRPDPSSPIPFTKNISDRNDSLLNSGRNDPRLKWDQNGQSQRANVSPRKSCRNDPGRNDMTERGQDQNDPDSLKTRDKHVPSSLCAFSLGKVKYMYM